MEATQLRKGYQMAYADGPLVADLYLAICYLNDVEPDMTLTPEQMGKVALLTKLEATRHG